MWWSITDCVRVQGKASCGAGLRPCGVGYMRSDVVHERTGTWMQRRLVSPPSVSWSPRSCWVPLHRSMLAFIR